MREQTVQVKTGVKKRYLLVSLLIVIACLLIVGVWIFAKEKDCFNPPAFDKNVQTGIPQPEESLSYGTIAAPTGFSVGICGTMYQQEDGSLLVDLTNPEINDVNIQCEIKDESGTTLYKSGVIKPGEYLERLTPLVELKNEAIPVEVSIYGYELTTWYSKGTVTLNNTLQPY